MISLVLHGHVGQSSSWHGRPPSPLQYCAYPALALLRGLWHDPRAQKPLPGVPRPAIMSRPGHQGQPEVTGPLQPPVRHSCHGVDHGQEHIGLNQLLDQGATCWRCTEPAIRLCRRP